MNQELRRITNYDDVLQLISVLEKYLNPSITEQNISIKEYCHKLIDQGVVIGCTNPNKCAIIAGYCNDLENRVAYISSLIVSPNLRGRGVGKALIKSFEEYALGCGMIKIRLEVFNQNKNVVDFYIKQGYILSDKNENSFYMVKDAI